MTTVVTEAQRGFGYVNGDGTLNVAGLELMQRITRALAELQAKTANISQPSTLDFYGGVDTASTTNAGQDFVDTGAFRWQRPAATADGSLAAGFYRGTTLEFQVASDGDVKNTNNSYGAISDARLKEQIANARSQWNDVKAFGLKNYRLKGGEKEHLGVMAQDLERTSPGLVRTMGDGTKAVAYSLLYLKAVGALQEAMARIEALEARVEALES